MTDKKAEIAVPAKFSLSKPSSIFYRLRHSESQKTGVGLDIARFFRRLWYMSQTIPPFLVAAFIDGKIFTADGRTLIRGKFRRFFISLVPGFAPYLSRRYGINGGCVNCGNSCKLLFQCPHWDNQSRLCSIYEDRPQICRTFPITPADIQDRNIASGFQSECGFDFNKN